MRYKKRSGSRLKTTTRPGRHMCAKVAQLPVLCGNWLLTRVYHRTSSSDRLAGLHVYTGQSTTSRSSAC